MDPVDIIRNAENRALREALDRQTRNIELCTTWILVAIVLLILGLFSYAHAHDAPPGMSQEEKAVAQFYSRWMRPDDPNNGGRRHHSCCSMQDCHEVRIKEQGGTVFFLDYWSWPEQPQWRPVPANIIEENQPDPEESPDGKNHACASAAFVYCFTRGSLI